MVSNEFYFSNELVSIFLHTENSTKLLAIKFLKTLCIGCPFSACAYTFVSYFQAVGKGKISFIIAMLRKGAIDIPIMYLLSYLANCSEVYATPIADIICCFVAIVLYKTFVKTNDDYVNSN